MLLASRILISTGPSIVVLTGNNHRSVPLMRTNSHNVTIFPDVHVLLQLMSLVTMVVPGKDRFAMAFKPVVIGDPASSRD